MNLGMRDEQSTLSAEDARGPPGNDEVFRQFEEIRHQRTPAADSKAPWAFREV